ncbi:helix-turn-helix domain-containing protein, partial [Mesorhizobium sp.]
RYEAEIIRETLGRNGGDVRRTIEALGIPRKTFYDKLQRHGIVRSDFSREIKLVEPDRSPRR